MRKVLLLLVVTLIWSCQERLFGPEDIAQKVDDDVEFGTTAIRIPGLKELGKGAAKAEYIFKLTISGTDMEEIAISFQLGEKDTMVVIDKIPAGTARQFKGVLLEGGVITHEGIAEAGITSGKVAFVKLYLRGTGSAQVEVIVEDDTTHPPLKGCMRLEGTVEGLPFDELTIELLGMTGNQFWTYIRKNGEFAGKFWGTLSDHSFSGEFYLEGDDIGLLTFGHFSEDWTAFKAEAFDVYDTTLSHGSIDGYISDCGGGSVPHTPPSQGCFVDTIFADGDCMTKGELLIRYMEYCVTNKVIPGEYQLGASCSGNSDEGYIGLVFEYCTTDGMNAQCTSGEIEAPTGCLPQGPMIGQYLNFCIEHKAMPGSFMLMEPCTNGSEKGYSRISFDYCTFDGTPPPPPPPPASKCYGIDGVIIDDTLFGQLYMQMEGINESEFHSGLFRSGEMVGKFYGFFDKAYSEFTGFMMLEKQEMMVKGSFFDNVLKFEGMVLDNEDTTKQIGYIDGYTVDCSEISRTPPPPPPPPPVEPECYKVHGSINGRDLEGLVIEMLGVEEPRFWTYVRGSEGDTVGKFWGVFEEGEPYEFTGFFGLFDTTAEVMVKGVFSDDFVMMKAQAFDMNDTTLVVGGFNGEGVSCDEFMGPQPPPVNLSGCFSLHGEFADRNLEGMTIKINDVVNGMFYSYIYSNDQMIGKFHGTTGPGEITGEFGFEDGGAMFRGGFTTNYDAFKGQLFSFDDTTVSVGYVVGEQTDCAIPQVPGTECAIDTMIIDKCVPEDELVAIAAEMCAEQGTELAAYTVWGTCEGDTVSLYNGIYFEYCPR